VVIRSWQDAVTCFMRSENIVTSNAMHNHLKGFKNAPRILGLMKDGHTKLSDRVSYERKMLEYGVVGCFR